MGQNCNNHCLLSHSKQSECWACWSHWVIDILESGWANIRSSSCMLIPASWEWLSICDFWLFIHLLPLWRVLLFNNVQLVFLSLAPTYRKVTVQKLSFSSHLCSFLYNLWTSLTTVDSWKCDGYPVSFTRADFI